VTVAFGGPLCRYYAAQEDGGDRAHLQAGVLRWRNDLQRVLGDRLPGSLNWDEDPAGPVREADLGASGLLALRLLAVYAERTDLEWPSTVPRILELDRAFREAAEADFGRSHFGQLLAAGAWLPLDFAFTFRASLPDGVQTGLGSLPLLLDQLRRLNGRTFQADAAALAEWLALPAEPGGELLDASRRGLAAMLDLAAWADARALPLVVREA
jgi:hypothetical protein